MRLIFEYGYNLAFHCPHRNGWPHSLKVHYIRYLKAYACCTSNCRHEHYVLLWHFSLFAEPSPLHDWPLEVSIRSTKVYDRIPNNSKAPFYLTYTSEFFFG